MGVMTVSTSVRPEDLAVVAGARGHSLDLDQSKQNGGRENTLKPMEVVLAALGGCITMVALAQGLFMVSLWVIYARTTRAAAGQGLLTLACVACVALGPLAVWLGAPLPWGLLLLSLGPAIAIVYNEHGRRHCQDAFAVR